MALSETLLTFNHARFGVADFVGKHGPAPQVVSAFLGLYLKVALRGTFLEEVLQQL